MKRLLTAIFLFFAIGASAQLDKIVPTAPSPFRLVNDYTNTLTGIQKDALEAKVRAYDDSTSNQVAIVIVASLEGNDESDYARAILRKWGVGSKQNNNGIVLLVSMSERKIRIEVGYGLEGAIPDITAKSIIENSIKPAFKENNYYRGLDKAVDDIMKAAAGEYKAPASYGKKSSGKKWTVGSIIALLIILSMFSPSRGRRGGGGTLSGAGWILGSILNSATRGGGGWSGGGGGGWSGGGSFGGGSGGGGGASGSW